MFLLDTNIVSEARRRDPHVTRWLRANRQEPMYLSIVTLGEIAKGIALLERRDAAAAGFLSDWLGGLQRDYASRILPIDDAVMMLWGKIAAMRPRGDLDAILAATARARGLALVSRNVRDFDDLDICLIDPWAV